MLSTPPSPSNKPGDPGRHRIGAPRGSALLISHRSMHKKRHTNSMETNSSKKSTIIIQEEMEEEEEEGATFRFREVATGRVRRREFVEMRRHHIRPAILPQSEQNKTCSVQSNVRPEIEFTATATSTRPELPWPALIGLHTASYVTTTPKQSQKSLSKQKHKTFGVYIYTPSFHEKKMKTKGNSG